MTPILASLKQPHPACSCWWVGGWVDGWARDLEERVSWRLSVCPPLVKGSLSLSLSPSPTLSAFCRVLYSVAKYGMRKSILLACSVRTSVLMQHRHFGKHSVVESSTWAVSSRESAAVEFEWRLRSVGPCAHRPWSALCRTETLVFPLREERR